VLRLDGALTDGREDRLGVRTDGLDGALTDGREDRLGVRTDGLDDRLEPRLDGVLTEEPEDRLGEIVVLRGAVLFRLLRLVELDVEPVLRPERLTTDGRDGELPDRPKDLQPLVLDPLDRVVPVDRLADDEVLELEAPVSDLDVAAEEPDRVREGSPKRLQPP
jgi:hypothetical protein